MSDIHWFWAKRVINVLYIMLEVWLINVWAKKHFYDWSEIYQQIKDELQRIELSAVWCVVEILDSNCRNHRIPDSDLLLIKI